IGGLPIVLAGRFSSDRGEVAGDDLAAPTSFSDEGCGSADRATLASGGSDSSLFARMATSLLRSAGPTPAFATLTVAAATGTPFAFEGSMPADGMPPGTLGSAGADLLRRSADTVGCATVISTD